MGNDLYRKLEKCVENVFRSFAGEPFFNIFYFMSKLFQFSFFVKGFQVQECPDFGLHDLGLMNFDHGVDVLILKEKPIVAIDADVF